MSSLNWQILILLCFYFGIRFLRVFLCCVFDTLLLAPTTLPELFFFIYCIGYEGRALKKSVDIFKISKWIWWFLKLVSIHFPISFLKISVVIFSGIGSPDLTSNLLLFFLILKSMALLQRLLNSTSLKVSIFSTGASISIFFSLYLYISVSLFLNPSSLLGTDLSKSMGIFLTLS